MSKLAKRSTLTERQFQLLFLIIQEYIKVGSPVSSQQLLENYKLNLSTATIRNEMQVLEENEYIVKHNYSSGRIPTNKGYEWYLQDMRTNPENVDYIKEKIDLIFKERYTNIDDILEEAMKLINSATKTASITRSNIKKGVRLEDMTLYKLDNFNALILFVFSNGKVINNEVSLKNIKFSDLKTTIQILFHRLKGTEIIDLQRTAESMKDLVSKNIKDIESKFQSIINMMFKKIGLEDFKYIGINNIVSNEYLKSMETVKKIVNMIETDSIWSLLQKTNSISAGNASITLELNDKELNDISVITKDIDVGNTSKSLMFVGSKNQDYKILIELLKVLENNLKNY